MEESLVSDITERLRVLKISTDKDSCWSTFEPFGKPSPQDQDSEWKFTSKTDPPDVKIEDISSKDPIETPTIGEYIFPDVQNVYIVQEREFIARRLPIYKIGMTVREAHLRFKAYSKSTETKLCMSVNDARTVENMLIDAFKTKFIQRTDIGTESFQGEILDMEELFTSIVHKYKRSPEGNATKESSILHPTPLTLDLIRKKIPLYTHKMIRNGNDGLKEFLLLLINTPNGPNMKCTNEEKLLFSRLDRVENGKPKWIKDGKKFVNNIFTEVGDDGKSLLKRVKEFWLDVKDAHLRSTNMEEREKYEKMLKDVGDLQKIFENEKVIRSRFVKEALIKVAKSL